MSRTQGDKLQGRTIVVTGATRGIGYGIAVGAAELHAHVVITGRTKIGPNSLEATANAVRQVGGTCDLYVVDHSDDDQVKTFFDNLSVDLGRAGRTLDVFVNNAFTAAGYVEEHTTKNLPFWERYTVPGNNNDPAKVWDLVNNVGARGNYVCSVLATRQMVKSATGGIVVNVSSLGGIVSIFDPAYCVGKTAVDRMSAEFALRASPNVKYITYCPGVVATNEITQLAEGEYNKETDKKLPKWNLESPLFVGRSLAALLGSSKHVNSTHGRVVLAAEIGDQFKISDERGFRPLSIRSLRFGVMSALPFLRDSFLRFLIPRSAVVPWWIFREVGGAVKYW